MHLRSPLATLSKQPHTIPFMGHRDTPILCSILYIHHFHFYLLCSSHLCTQQLSQTEATIEMEIILVSQGLRGNNFLLFEAYMSFLLVLGESYGCVALFTKVST